MKAEAEDWLGRGSSATRYLNPGDVDRTADPSCKYRSSDLPPRLSHLLILTTLLIVGALAQMPPMALAGWVIFCVAAEDGFCLSAHENPPTAPKPGPQDACLGHGRPPGASPAGRTAGNAPAAPSCSEEGDSVSCTQ